MPKTQQEYIADLAEQLKRQSDEIQRLKGHIAQLTAGVVPEQEYYLPDTIWAEAALTKEGKPFLMLRQGPSTFQLDMASALSLALHILEAREAAISDQFVFDFMRSVVGLSEQVAARTLLEFREFCQERITPLALDGPPPFTPTTNPEKTS